MRQNLFHLITFIVLTATISACSKKGNNDQSANSKELLSPAGGNPQENVTPLLVAQKSWITSYTIDRTNYTATVTSLDSILDKGVFRVIYNNTDSASVSFTCVTLNPLYLKMIKRPGRDSVTVIYDNVAYNLDDLRFDSVDKVIRNTAAYAALMYFDVRDYLAGTTQRSIYNCNCNRAVSMTAIGFGGTASSSLRRAQYSQSSWTSFWGCSNIQVEGTDTSCWPLDSHGMCITTIEYTANCPWYAIPFGLN